MASKCSIGMAKSIGEYMRVGRRGYRVERDWNGTIGNGEVTNGANRGSRNAQVGSGPWVGMEPCHTIDYRSR